jgi:hypothetical protein
VGPSPLLPVDGRKRLLSPLMVGGKRLASFWRMIRQLVSSRGLHFSSQILHSITRASLATAGSEGGGCWGSICVLRPERAV